MRQILLLAEQPEHEALLSVLRRISPLVEATAISTKDELAEATQQPDPALRLVTFCTSVIIPTDILERLNGPAYNFHPGPPEVRGLFPSVYALYDGHEQFGATAHEIAEEIDSGPIVGVERTDLPDGIDRFNTEIIARRLVSRLFVKMAAYLVLTDDPLPHIDETWSGPIHTRKEFDALCRLPLDINEAEFARRYRAIGEGPDHALNFKCFGRTFKITPLPGQTTVYKGGKAVES